MSKNKTGNQRRLLIVSNRLPVSIERRKRGLSYRPSAGGLATGLGTFHQIHNSVWVGWPGLVVEEEEKARVEERLQSQFRSYPVFLSRHHVEEYYHGFSNRTIWPLFHYFPQFVKYEASEWKAYLEVNRLFCKRVTEMAHPDDIIWIHDYHLTLLPRFLRKSLPKATIGFFLHIPFPSLEIFRLLPWRKEILQGLLGADLIGFHTYDYARHFLSTLLRLYGLAHEMGQITVENRLVKVDVFPMGIDVKRFEAEATSALTEKEVTRLRRKIGNRKIILSVDRLDYTKGIPERLESFGLFLERHPEWNQRVTLILVAVPSRTRMESYRLLKRQVDELVGRINGRYSTAGWVPIWYLYRLLPFHTLVTYYRIADVSLVTPLRDGMNLIAKEFVATRGEGKGVLILSEMAGASKELGEALIINPNNREETAKAIEEALTMAEDEQCSRNRTMQRRLSRYTLFRWADDFISALLEVKNRQNKLETRKFSPQVRNKLIRRYQESSHRLFLLDYDGTLVPLVEQPRKAKPDPELLTLLKELTTPSQNAVVLISGRDRETLQQWFKDPGFALVAEHGVWMRAKDSLSWRIMGRLSQEWKDWIKPVLEVFTDRLPGSFVEEKEYSLVCHYRRADPELASLRAKELMEILTALTANTDLQVLQGSKVIEVKSASVNKGEAVMNWISGGDFDFILGVGDDLTDEDLFRVLPKGSHSVKVGLGTSKAGFYVDSPKEVRQILKDLLGKEAQR